MQAFKNNTYSTVYDLNEYKREIIKTAKELLYGPEVIEKIKAANSQTEITNIMADARRKI